MGSSRGATRVYVEDWAAAYGSPYLVKAHADPDDVGVLVEDGDALVRHAPATSCALRAPVAFVDGVRRGDACLYQTAPATGLLVRGLAGSHGCGAVLVEPGGRPQFGPAQITRMVIWGGGLTGRLPDQAGGWSWQTASVTSAAPDAPLAELQERMRRAEAELAERLCAGGYLTVVDGPLHYVRSRDRPVVGYVKTHTKPLLPRDEFARIPDLAPGERTSLFALGRDRYSAYLRLAPLSLTSGPWTGIVRIEVPASAGLGEAAGIADAIAATVPRYAGVPHRDPRAPQNLQPIGALEGSLRHLIGHPGLARRAVRSAVTQLAARAAPTPTTGPRAGAVAP